MGWKFIKMKGLSLFTISVVFMSFCLLGCNFFSSDDTSAKGSKGTPATIQLDIPDTVLIAGDSMQVTAEVLDQKGEPLDYPITWQTSDEYIASVSSFGKIFGWAKGRANIVAKSEDVESSFEIRVKKSGRLFGWSCEDQKDSDVVQEIIFTTTHPIGVRNYGCLIVDSTESHPVRSGRRSFRFQVSPRRL